MYNIVRGDFSVREGSMTGAQKRTLAGWVGPSMRTMMQEAARELNTGSMSLAVLLSYADVGTTVAVGFRCEGRVGQHLMRVRSIGLVTAAA